MRRLDEKRGPVRKAFSKEIRYDILAEETRRRANKKFTAFCVDISEGGLGINTGISLEKGRIMRISLPVSVANVVIPTFGEVAWSSPQGDRFGIGIRFLQ